MVYIPKTKIPSVATWFVLSVTVNISGIFLVSGQTGSNLDRFTYGNTVGNTYGPADWSKIKCPDPDVCLGWADTMPNSQGWKIDETNHCKNCPADGNGGSNCKVHHNSPINLERNRAIVGHPKYNQCIDGHWIAYYDSSCSFDELRNKNGFTIERHALTVKQPMSDQLVRGSKTLYAIDCSSDGRRLWGRADYPKGFSNWWLLSHIDFKVPSEHTQEGKRYSAEIQMYHFYEVSGKVAGVDNEMGTISIFMEVYDDAKEWPELNRLICAWRETEEKVRKECGLPSITERYPGCPKYGRKRRSLRHQQEQSLEIDIGLDKTNKTNDLDNNDEDSDPVAYKPAISAHDIIMENFYHQSLGNTSYEPKLIHLDGHAPEPDPSFDWDKFIQDQNSIEESRLQRINTTRHLQSSSDDWFNYFAMLKVKTEYYFRYSGAQTSPPCYGDYISQGSNNRKQTNHWRVMKDPIPIPQTQLMELHRLIKERIAPKSSAINSCKKDTAAIPDPVDPSKKVMVSRPLQAPHKAHFKVFCECTNWRSKFLEDSLWCQRYKNDQLGRFYKNPYNFNHDGF